MNNVDLYEKDGKVAVLITGGFGAAWSANSVSPLAYDKRIIKFWLDHKDNKEFMRSASDYKDNFVNSYVKQFFKDWGYDYVYLGAFDSLELVWVEKGKPFQIREYDGSEWIEYYDPDKWITF